MTSLLYGVTNSIDLSQFGKDVTLYQEVYRLDAVGFLVDRTQSTNTVWKTKLVLPFPSNNTPIMSFADAAEVTARRLISTGKTIYAMWSGGIDSTFMVTALIKCGVGDQLVIVMNPDSIKEYPLFYNKHILGRYQLLSTEELMRLAGQGKLGNGIMLSAEHGDQVVGSPMCNFFAKKMGNDFLAKPYSIDLFRDFLTSIEFKKQAVNCFADWYHATSKLSPRPIQNMWDMAWWHGFNFKWQAIRMKLMSRIEPNVNLVTFFSSDEFQMASIHQEIDLTSLITFKNVFKQMILDFTKDQEYFDNKFKFPSSTLYFANPAKGGITEQYNRLEYGFDMKPYYQPNNYFNNWLKDNHNA